MTALCQPEGAGFAEPPVATRPLLISNDWLANSYPNHGFPRITGFFLAQCNAASRSSCPQVPCLQTQTPFSISSPSSLAVLLALAALSLPCSFSRWPADFTSHFRSQQSRVKGGLLFRPPTLPSHRYLIPLAAACFPSLPPRPCDSEPLPPFHPRGKPCSFRGSYRPYYSPDPCHLQLANNSGNSSSPTAAHVGHNSGVVFSKLFMASGERIKTHEFQSKQALRLVIISNSNSLPGFVLTLPARISPLEFCLVDVPCSLWARRPPPSWWHSSCDAPFGHAGYPSRLRLWMLMAVICLASATFWRSHVLLQAHVHRRALRRRRAPRFVDTAFLLTYGIACVAQHGQLRAASPTSNCSYLRAFASSVSLPKFLFCFSLHQTLYHRP